MIYFSSVILKRMIHIRFWASCNVKQIILPSTVVNSGSGKPKAGWSKIIQQETKITQSSRTIALYQRVVLDDEHISDGEAVTATRISTTAGPWTHTAHLRLTRRTRTHTRTLYVPIRLRRSTLPGLLPVSHLQSIVETRAIDHAHSRCGTWPYP